MAGRVPGLAVLLDIRRQLGEGEHPGGVDDDGKSQASHEGKGDFRGDPDPDRRVRPLQRLGPHPQVVAPIVFAREGEAFLSPRLDDDLQVFVEALPALGEGRVESVVRVRERATPHAELDPTLTDVVQRGDVLGDVDRMGQGQEHHRQANADALGPGGDGAGDRDRRGQNADRGKMVLRQPHRVNAQGLRGIHQREALGKGLTVRHPRTGGELDEDPGLHERRPASRPG